MFAGYTRPISAAMILCSLAACRVDSDSSAQSPAPVTVVAAGAMSTVAAAGAMPKDNATALAGAPPVSRLMPSAATLAGFDYANGTRLPDKASLSLGVATFKPGASMAYIPVTLDRETPNTVIARVITVNGTDTTRLISGKNYTTVDTVVIFRPGDPLRRTVAVPILSAANGQQFSTKLREAPWGASQGTATATITAASDQAATTPEIGPFRAPRNYAATGSLQYDMVKGSTKWSDQGGTNMWSTSFPFGRTQTANGETGLYVDGWIYSGIEAPLRYTDQGLVMHSQVLPNPISYGGVSYKYGSIVLNARNLVAAQIGYGQYEWIAKMPTRRGSWPALWLVATSGWPPEIDVYEGFGYQSYWDFDRHISATIHGGSNGVRSFQRGTNIQAEQAYGLSGFTQGFHSYAIDIQRDYITWFVDGTETYQSVNPFQGFRWYPIMDVAVKTDSAYTDGTGDMVVSRFRTYVSP
ncbi:hypothetical protein ACVWZA_002731 [Sphingomonas sp. UYAg733]